MTLADISDISQTIAALAVVVSLVYLAIQTRQAAINAKAAIHENRASTILGHIENMVDDEFHPIWRKGSLAAADITDDEIDRYLLFVSGVILVWEERFRQKCEGMLDEDRWAASERTITRFVAAPGFRAVVVGMLPGFDPDFRTLMEQHLVQGPHRAASGSDGWVAGSCSKRTSGEARAFAGHPGAACDGYRLTASFPSCSCCFRDSGY